MEIKRIETFTRRWLIHMPPSLFQRMCDAARRAGTTPSELTRVGIINELERLEAKQTAPTRRAPRSRQAEHQSAAA